MGYIELEIPTDGFGTKLNHRKEIVVTIGTTSSQIIDQLAAQMTHEDIRAFIAMIGVDAVQNALNELKD